MLALPSHRSKWVILENPLFYWFVSIHVVLAVFLGRSYAFAPDEAGYFHTFNYIYAIDVYQSAQYNSGWIATPKIFLWIAYIPAKILNLVGILDFLAIRLLSILLATISLLSDNALVSICILVRPLSFCWEPWHRRRYFLIWVTLVVGFLLASNFSIF